MSEVFLMCKDFEEQKIVRDRIYADTGIRIRRTVNDYDKIKESYGIGVYLYKYVSEILKIVKPGEIIITYEEVPFKDWKTLNLKGVKIFNCKDSYNSLKGYLIDVTSDVNKPYSSNQIRLLEMQKSEIKSAIDSEELDIVTVYGISAGVGKSTFALSFANAITLKYTDKRVAVLDLDKQYTFLQGFIKNTPTVKKIDSTTSSLGSIGKLMYRDDERNIHYFVSEDEVSLNSISYDEASLVNMLYLIKGQFDVIIIDTDSLYNKEKDILFEISDEVYVICDDIADNINNHSNFFEKIINVSELDKDKFVTVYNKYTEADKNKFKLAYINHIMNIGFDNNIKKDRNSKIYFSKESIVFRSILELLGIEIKEEKSLFSKFKKK